MKFKLSTLWFLSAVYCVTISVSQDQNKDPLEEQEEADSCNFGLCDIVKLGNSNCNPECLTADCNYDLGDCCVNIEGCAQPLISNGECEEGCKVTECAFDWDDCLEEDDIDISLFPFCAFQLTIDDDFSCTYEVLTNRKCDSEESCDFTICNFDAFDCEGEVIKECNSGQCSLNSLGDGQCDPECLTPDCNYDLGDCCIDIQGCTKPAIANDFCDLDCLNPECAYDWGDCFFNTSASNLPFCAFESSCDFQELSNGVCNENCDTAECNFDFRDCEAGCFLELLDVDCDTFPISLLGLIGIGIGCIAVICFIVFCCCCCCKFKFNDKNSGRIDTKQDNRDEVKIVEAPDDELEVKG